MNTEILSLMFFPSIGIAIAFWIGTIIAIAVLGFAIWICVCFFNGEASGDKFMGIWGKLFTKNKQLSSFVICLAIAPMAFLNENYSAKKMLAETYFSSIPQRIAVSIPFASDEKDRIAVKIDELMELERTLGSRKRSTSETVTAFEASISKRLAVLPSLSQKGKDFEADLIGQERVYLAKAKKEVENLSDALTEVNYLKEYAKNRYAELGNDQAKTEIIGRIGGFTSKFR